MFLKWLLPSLPWDPLSSGFAKSKESNQQNIIQKNQQIPGSHHVSLLQVALEDSFFFLDVTFSFTHLVYNLLEKFFYRKFITKSNLKIIVMQANWLFLFKRNLFLNLTELFFRKRVFLSFTTSKNLLSKHPEVEQQFKALLFFFLKHTFKIKWYLKCYTKCSILNYKKVT